MLVRAEDDSKTDVTASEVTQELVGNKQGLAQKARKAFMVTGIVTGILLAAAMVSKAILQNDLEMASAAAVETLYTVPTVQEYKKQKPIPPKPYECSIAKQNCAKSKCCDNFGFQCYSKNATYGSCMEKCEPAKLAKAGNGSWTCTPLGLRNRCADDSEDCSAFGCCASDGSQCYEQSPGKALCKKTCDASSWPTQGWSCAAIGPRNTYSYKGDTYKGMLETSPPMKGCAYIGENCAATKCCSWSGYSCYEKNATWSSCLNFCIPGKPNGGISNEPIVQAGAPEKNPPSHWWARFDETGPGAWTCKRLMPKPLTPGVLKGTSLYCYSVALDKSNGGKKTIPELDLLANAQMLGAHVFACDAWDVFSDVSVTLGSKSTDQMKSTVKVEYTKVFASNGSAVRRPNTQIYVNTELFMNVWRAIKKNGEYAKHEWVVKSDPATVFIPARLRIILQTQLVTQKGVYLENCKYVRMSLHGSLEVVSKVGFDTFLDKLDDCYTTLPWRAGIHTHFKYYGEDKFLQFCMDKHGVDKVASRQMVEQVPKPMNIYGLHLTVSCPGHRIKFETAIKKWKPNCTRSKTAGLHPFKTVKEWTTCFENTTASV